MNTQIGKSQTTATKTSAATVSTTSYYFTKWVSPPLKSGVTISAQTWTLSFAGLEANAAANWPTTTTGTVPISCYVWRPGTGALVGAILNGTSVTGFAEAGTSSTAISGTFTGASVVALAGDVIVFELVATTTQGGATARLLTFNYDGTTEASTSSCASFLSAGTDTLAFSNKLALADTLTLTDPLAKTKQWATKSLPTEAVGSCIAVFTVQVGRAIRDSLAAVKTLGGHHYSYTLTTDAIGSVTDALARKGFFKRALADTLTLTDPLTKKALLKRALTEALGSITDSMSKLRKVPKALTTEALGSVTETIVEKALHKRALTEALGTITDALGKKALLKRAITEAIGTVTETLAKKALLKRALAEAIGAVTDVLSKKALLKRTLTETLGAITDALSRKGFFKRTVTDSATVSETLTKKALLKRALSDALGAITDALAFNKISGTHLHSVYITEALGVITDPIKKKASHALAEALSITDALVKKALLKRALTEAIGSVTDSMKKKSAKVISESITLTDSLVKHATHALTAVLGAVSETLSKRTRKSISEVAITISDALRKRASHSISETAVTVTEVIKKLAIHKLTTEVIGSVTETLSKSRHQFRTISDNVGFVTETLRKKAAKYLSQPLGAIVDVPRTRRSAQTNTG